MPFSTAFKLFQTIHVPVYCHFMTVGCNCPELCFMLEVMSCGSSLYKSVAMTAISNLFSALFLLASGIYSIKPTKDS